MTKWHVEIEQITLCIRLNVSEISAGILPANGTLKFSLTVAISSYRSDSSHLDDVLLFGPFQLALENRGTHISFGFGVKLGKLNFICKKVSLCHFCPLHSSFILAKRHSTKAHLKSSNLLNACYIFVHVFRYRGFSINY